MANQAAGLSRQTWLLLFFLALLPVWYHLTQTLGEPPPAERFWWCESCQHELPYNSDDEALEKMCPRCVQGRMRAHILPSPAISLSDLLARVLIGLVALLALTTLVLLSGRSKKRSGHVCERWCTCPSCGHRIHFQAADEKKRVTCHACGAELEATAATATPPPPDAKHVSNWLKNLAASRLPPKR